MIGASYVILILTKILTPPTPLKEMMILLRWVTGPHPQGQTDNGDVDKEKLNGKTCISKTLYDHDDNFTEAVFHVFL